MGTGTMNRPPLPPFSRESAIQKVRLAEDAWNTRDPRKVALAYAIDSRWRNRSEFINGRDEIKVFLSRKWAKELDYRLIKELWAFTENRIAVRFAFEWHESFFKVSSLFGTSSLNSRRALSTARSLNNSCRSLVPSCDSGVVKIDILFRLF